MSFFNLDKERISPLSKRFSENNTCISCLLVVGCLRQFYVLNIPEDLNV
jgi:hypothetical protein